VTTRKTLIAFALLGVGCSAQAQTPCEPSADLEFVCGPQNPEDLVLVPGLPWIIASGMAEGAGFYLLDARSGDWGVLPFGAQHDPVFGSCSTPPSPQSLNTHGLNLRASSRSRATLYVVGHGAREAIEVFAVDASAAPPILTWRGCVPMPDGLAANSVASFPDGSLVATVLLMPGKTFADSVARRPTGAVFEWSPGDRGFELIHGTELPGNNGIEAAENGAEIYVVSSGLQTVVAFSRSNPARQLRTTRPLPFTPDNLHFDTAGRLLTAGMANDVPECGGAPGPQHDLTALATCPRGTIAVAIDPVTMQDRVIVQTAATPLFSNATMVLTRDGEFWLGTFAGDRIGRGVLR